MAKHPVPKRRASRTRGDRRYATWKKVQLKKLNNFARTVPCPKCKQPRKTHTACPTCGHYRGRTVVDYAKKNEKKVEKVKAE